jgi:hypothetical protein
MFRRAPVRVLASCAVAIVAGAAAVHAQHDMHSMHSMHSTPNTLTAAEKAAGWTLLFDGTSMKGWHLYQKPGQTTGWEAKDGMLVKTATTGDLMSDRQFGSFEMVLEWKIESKGNSGIFFWATEGTEVVYQNAPEIQVLDNIGHRDGLSPLTSAGALYGLAPASPDLVKPLGEWNQVRVLVTGAIVETWFNGTKIADQVDFDSRAFKAQVAKTKFAQWPTYGLARKGSIGLQEHGNMIWYRNIKIREIK